MYNKLEKMVEYDVLMNQKFAEYHSNGIQIGWFIPETNDKELINQIDNLDLNNLVRFEIKMILNKILPNMYVEKKMDENGNIESIYVILNIDNKMYRVVSNKDYGIVKSRIILKNNKYYPHEDSTLIPFSGTIIDYDDYWTKIQSNTYLDGFKNGECFKYYSGLFYDKVQKKEIQNFELTTYEMGKKNGQYFNTKFKIKGNYVNNKKNGNWEILFNQLYNETKFSYQKRYKLDKRKIDNFVKKQFDLKFDSDTICSVYYVNDILHGEFKIDEFEGKFQLGLVNGELKYERKKDYFHELEILNYNNGLKEGYQISYDKFFENESILDIYKYEKGENKGSIKLSTNRGEIIPQNICSFTNNHLNEDFFRYLKKQNIDNLGNSLESFLSQWVSMKHFEFDYLN